MDIEKRIRMAEESILENEAIREGTDDSGASALLDWGIFCARNITGETAQLEDDDEAEEASYPRMRALREMLDIVKSLIKIEPNSPQETTFFADLLEKATLVYNADKSLPQNIYSQALAAHEYQDSYQKINAVRTLIEQYNNL